MPADPFFTSLPSTASEQPPLTNGHIYPQRPLTNGDADPTIDDESPSLRSLCARLNARITAFLQEDVKADRLKSAQAQTRISLKIIQEALDKYPLHSISISYNGGKDCLVLLLLFLSLLSNHPDLPHLLPAIYIPPRHPFPAVEAFVSFSAKTYYLALARYSKTMMRDAFAEYLKKNVTVEAILVGTRRTDPHGGKLGSFQPTDGGWPAFMRVHPVIEWKYGEVWAFLKHLDIPYCELYDQGYTSLGCTTDTHPNPALRMEGEEVRFRPAYELEDDEQERLGRDW